MAPSLAEWLADGCRSDSQVADGFENRQNCTSGPRLKSEQNLSRSRGTSANPIAYQKLVISGWFEGSQPCTSFSLVSIVKSSAFWTTLFAVAMLAWDPLQVRQMLALARSYRHFDCQSTTSQCCPRAPDGDGWPTDHASRLLGSEFFYDTGIPGPETLAWDPQGNGPYTGLADGRVFRWNERSRSLESFAHASPFWTEEVCAYSKRGTRSSKLNLEHLCGRPLGLKFHPITGELFIIDAYFGLAKVSRVGGQAKLLTNQSHGVAHTFSNDLDIHEDGTVYFTVSSTRRPRRECNLLVMERESTGLVLAYDPETTMTSVVMKDLHYPNGIAISKDGTFLLVASTLMNKLLRYWLRGPLTGVIEDFAQLSGYPDNIHSTENGEFWVALHGRRTKFHTWLCNNGWASRIMYSLYNTYNGVSRYFADQVTPVAIKYDAEGQVLDVLEDRFRTSHTQFLSSALERDGRLWLSSIYSPIISSYKLDSERCNVTRKFH